MCKNLEGVDRHLPIVGLANSDEGVKVSARGTQSLVERHLNLARAMSEAAHSVGGVEAVTTLRLELQFLKGPKQSF